MYLNISENNILISVELAPKYYGNITGNKFLKFGHEPGHEPGVRLTHTL